MRLLTINLHCRQEVAWRENLRILADFIKEQQVDVVLLQECAQPLETLKLRSDNDVLLLKSLLKNQGLNFDVRWTLNHIGFKSLYEGLGVLSRFSILETEGVLISQSSDITDWQTRKAQIITLDMHGEILSLCNLHLGLQGNALLELKRLKNLVELKDFIVAGDFNIPDSSSTYREMREILNLPDVYKELVGSSDPTFFNGADGWEGITGQRIDYVFGHRAVRIERVFLGTDAPRISDHAGLLVDFSFLASERTMYANSLVSQDFFH
jgi:endonuclease/exonuclease/phosphatase family metal-dependent hydrolase